MEQLNDIKKIDDTKKIVVSDDQNTVSYGGITATFKPVNKVTKNTCRHCWFDRFPGACSTFICSSSLRKDGREGVFTVQEMPVIKSKKK